MITPKEIKRSNRKTLSIKINGQGDLIVYAPIKMSDRKIYEFLEEKRIWIERNVAKIKGDRERYSALNLNDGETIPYFSGDLTVKTICSGRIKEENGALFVKSGDTEGFKRFIKKDFGKYCAERVKKIASFMGAKYIGVSFNFAKTRWGSCSAKNKLNFSLYLAFVPAYLSDYVIVHELAHTFHKNHGDKFWKTVERFMPDYKLRRKALKEYSRINGLI